MKKMSVVVNNNSGLHARPASLFVVTAKKFQADITVVKDNRYINGKSIMGILSIGATKGDNLEILIEGADEKDAYYAIEELFNKKIIQE